MKAITAYFKGSCRIRCLLLVLIALVVSDGFISQFLVRYGLGREINPFLHTLVNEGNSLPIKLAGAFLCALILWDVHKTRPKAALVTTSIFVGVYTVIVFWNLGVFFFAGV